MDTGPTGTENELTEVDHSLIEKCLKAFQALGEDDEQFDELFQKIKLLYVSMEEHEKEGLFRAIIEQIEVPKQEVAPYVDALMKCAQDDPQWPALLSEVRNRFYSPRLRCGSRKDFYTWKKSPLIRPTIR